jgi:undecaprenyl diphosphate synthase
MTPDSQDSELIPQHVACIMDGNGRWATRRGLPRTAGHAQAEVAILSVLDAAIDLGITWLTLYTFSTENWSRPEAERNFIFQLVADMSDRHSSFFHSRGVRVRYMGRRGDPRIPANVSERIDRVETLTEHNCGLTLTFALNYGGRTEIADAASRLSEQRLPITVGSLSAAMYCVDTPDPDLVLRFGGERRLSNFLLWHIAYSEFDFRDTLWPDVRGTDLYQAVERYSLRTRRFGGLSSPGVRGAR